MFNKHKILAFTTMTLLSSHALASYGTTPPSEALRSMHTPFKVAVVKNTTGVAEIKNGDYQEGINAIASNTMDSNTKFNDTLNLCAAKLKLGEYTAAETACSNAITVISKAEITEHNNYLKSIAYSNRGIVRHYLTNKAGSFADFNQALSLDDNKVVRANVKALKHALLKSELLAVNTVLN